MTSDPHRTRVHVVMAVKDLTGAKSRLVPEFDESVRTELVLAMLADTVSAAAAAPTVCGWSVVTPDSRVAAAVHAMGGAVIDEPVTDTVAPGPRGDAPLNTAIGAAASAVRSGADVPDVLALQADLPALRTAEVIEALAAAPQGRSVVVDHTGSGTAALILRGPDGTLNPQFGVDSARRHLTTGARELTGRWPGLRLDVDALGDLHAAVALGIGPNTRALLDAIGWLGKG